MTSKNLYRIFNYHHSHSFKKSKLEGNLLDNCIVTDNEMRYFGDYFVNEETGKITDTGDNRMYLKEYKYYIHEISPSRKEVRLFFSTS